MEIAAALDRARADKRGVLVTLKADGRPQLSNIFHAVGDDGLIRISVTADRAKAVNAGRDPRVSLYLGSEDFWSYVVIEGTAERSAVVAAVDSPEADQLVELYRSLVGEHEDWDDYRRALVADRRLVLTITPTHAYGMA